MTDTIPRLLLSLAESRADLPALRHKLSGTYREISWQELSGRIRLWGRALIHLGIAPGDRIAIMAPNIPEWVFADLGGLAAGAVTVPVYHTEGRRTVVHILKDSQTRVLLLHSAPMAAEILQHLDELPVLERIIRLQGRGDAPQVQSVEDFLAGGGAVPPERLEERLAAGKTDDLATLVYTSGTTGLPKGVRLSHRNILSNLAACEGLFPVGPGDECLSFLPLSHVFERVDGYYYMLRQGVVVAYAESLEAVPQNMQEIRPTVIISVPRFYEKIYTRIMDQVAAAPRARRKLFDIALRYGKARVRRELAGEEVGLSLRVVTAMAEKAVFSKLKGRLGGRVRFFISGGAPLRQDVAEFFQAAGLPILEGYGLTETAGGIAVNTLEKRRLGTVGRPFPNTEVRIAPDGEILLRGDAVFEGYWHRPGETHEALNGGWFHTGDIGTLDEDGFLRITDRKKDLIITASGENIAPQPLENLFKEDDYLANALVFGDRKPYLTALLVPDLEKLGRYAREEKGIAFENNCDLVNRPQVLEMLRERIDSLQEELPPFQRVKRFTVLSGDFSKSELTPTLKIKRKVVAEHFQQVLEEMYAAKDHGIHDSGFCVVEELTEEEKD